MRTTSRRKTCCVCGDYAGEFPQWHNRDTGFGICARCVAWLRQPTPTRDVRESEENISSYYGVEGVHFAAPSRESAP